MRHELLKRVIYDQHEIIKNAEIFPREYSFDPKANYVLTGLRRAGKSTILYDICRKYVESGVEWERIIYINFEDERLAEFRLEDFDDILIVQAELSSEKGIFFFDEIQNIPGWEKFARRLADAKEHVYITGSNAKMLSRDIETTLGGRYFTKYITPYSFREFLHASGVKCDEQALFTTKSIAEINRGFDSYYTYGGFPEALNYISKKDYVSGVYQKVLLGDVVSGNKLRNESAAKILIKKIAESVRSDISFTKLHNTLKSIGVLLSKDSVIDYTGYAEDAYLIFSVKNYFSRFAEREGNPKYYFTDNGLLNLFLIDKNTALLENVVASALKRRYPDCLYYMKSSQTGIDIDFYAADDKTAIQVSYSIEGDARKREIENLIKLSGNFAEAKRFIIITREEEETIVHDGTKIEVIPVCKFLIDI